MHYLMSISIGPVQDFIATARRSRDLWFGSWLLSELSKAAANKIVELNNNDLDCLIFPAVVKTDSYDWSKDLEKNSAFNVPNKILTRGGETPSVLASKIYQAIQDRLIEIKNDVFEEISSNFDEELANSQIKDLIEFNWVAVPFVENDYVNTRKKVEYLISARKATRNFEQRIGTEARKSSLDGQRESVIYEGFYPEANDAENLKRQIAKRLYDKFRVRENERLCGVGLLKRRGNAKNEEDEKIDGFYSTSHVAAKPLLVRLRGKNDANAENNKQWADKFKKQLKEIGIKPSDLNTTPETDKVFGKTDGHLLYEERMRDYFDNEEKVEGTDERKIDAAKRLLKEFFKKAFNNENLKPSPYYALLLADGDSMGKAIDAQDTPEKHQAISQALSAFAKSVRTIVNDQHDGSLIYAGGDDVLALVPIHTVLKCAKKLADEFKEQLSSFKYDGDKSPTLSVGIAVAHHIEPMQDALTLARQAEKEAKAVEGKNALAVIVDKRSGTSRTIKGKWGEVDNRLRELIEFDKGSDVSRQTAYELRDLALQLEVKDQDKNDKLNEIKIVEARRILKRKLSEMGKKDFDKEKFSRMFELLKERDGITKLSDELIIAKVFADAMKQAEDIL